MDEIFPIRYFELDFDHIDERIIDSIIFDVSTQCTSILSYIRSVRYRVYTAELLFPKHHDASAGQVPAHQVTTSVLYTFYNKSLICKNALQKITVGDFSAFENVYHNDDANLLFSLLSNYKLTQATRKKLYFLDCLKTELILLRDFLVNFSHIKNSKKEWLISYSLMIVEQHFDTYKNQFAATNAD